MKDCFHDKTIEQTYNILKTQKDGLTSQEAAKRLEGDGKNVLPEGKKRSAALKFLLQFKDVMIIILMVAAVISFVLGEWIDGGIILAIVIINAVLSFVQEFKAEKAMESLKNLTKPFCKVIRNGEIAKIKSEDVVVGDIVVLESGDIVPADLRLVEQSMLKCDESSLTGESVPVLKNHLAKLAQSAALGDRSNMAFAGCTVTYGRAMGIVVATGKNTEIGKIASALQTSKQEPTPLQKSLKVLGRILTVVVVIVAVITFVCELFLSNTLSIKDAFFTSIALAVAAIPESLPMVVTVIMALGVSKLANKKAIVKKLHAIETLGCCDVICSDKTGTLTQNVMTVKSVWCGGSLCSDLDCDKKNPAFEKLALVMALCNDSLKQGTKFVGDPTETALANFAFSSGFDKAVLEKKYPRTIDIPFDSVRKMMSTQNGNHMLLKGGVDEVLSVCTNYYDGENVVVLTDEIRQKILMANKSMTERAERVLAGAFKMASGGEYCEQDMTFVGLVGMIDPPRPDVAAAVEKCKNAGMRPVMITGDHKQTAFAIAKQIGIATKPSQVLTGAEIDKLSPEQLKEKLKHVCVFARVSPQNKVQIVRAFKSMGKVVAMTGDGVNDAPSLKEANIGVGMGITGTDVTKEVANMIVADDSFSTIVLAVEEGRKIYQNIQKTINFLFASNLCEVLVILIGVLFFSDYVMLTAIQILFTNVISDSLPALALGVEPAEKDIMNQPPRSSKNNIFSGGMWQNLIFQSIAETILVLSSFLIGLFAFKNSQVATTMTFLTLNFIQLFFVLTIRCQKSIFLSNPLKNKVLLICIAALIGVLLIVALTPLSALLGLVGLNIWQWLIVLGLSILIIPLNELYKLARSLFRFSKKSNR